MVVVKASKHTVPTAQAQSQHCRCKSRPPVAKNMADYRKEMDAAYTYVDDNCALRGIYGNQGARIILRLAARASHHAMPFLGSLCRLVF